MKFVYNANKKPVTLKFVVNTKKPEKIRVRVYNRDKADTFYIDRYKTVNGQSPFFIKMPIAPKNAVIEVYNEKVGEKPKGKDDSFWISGKQTLKLEMRKECFACLKDSVNSFIKFMMEFCENAGWMSAGRSVYFSNDGRFRIEYLDVIRNSAGKPMKTPARIHQDTGVIQISKAHFKTYTVPRRVAILCHEYSHFYENENARDEIEADLNGLLIYLALGFPKVEAHQAFLEVFKGSPSDLNVERYKALNNFIEKFDDLNFKCVSPVNRYNA